MPNAQRLPGLSAASAAKIARSPEHATGIGDRMACRSTPIRQDYDHGLAIRPAAAGRFRLVRGEGRDEW